MNFRDRKRSGDLKGYLIMAVVTVLILVTGSYFFVNEEKRIKVDKNTFCPVNEAEHFGKTVALLDLTDPLNKPQKEFFLKAIKEIKKKFQNITV